MWRWTSLGGDICTRVGLGEVVMGREPGDLAIERLLDERGEHPLRTAVARTASQADALVRLLRHLPPHQRAVVVLRYWGTAHRGRDGTVAGLHRGHG